MSDQLRAAITRIGALTYAQLRGLTTRGDPELRSLLDALDADELATAQQVIALLLDLLQPLPQRKRDADGDPIARGAVEVKAIPRQTASGATVTSRYVYIRLWHTRGGADRRDRRLKSVYVRDSRKLAAALDELTARSAHDERAALESAILDAYHAGQLDQFVAAFNATR